MKTVSEKLQIKPGDQVAVVGTDDEVRALLGPLPESATTVEGIDRPIPDVAVMFAADRAHLDAHLVASLPHLAHTRAVWIAYPKGNRADINRDSIWRRLEELGWTLSANVSLGDIWSAVRAKPQP